MRLRFKNIISIGIIISMLFSFFSISVNALGYGEEWENYSSQTTKKYKDVSESFWAFDAINEVSAKNWFGGYPDGSFMPNASITRAEALKVFVVFLGLEISDVTESSFYDVDANEWYAPYIEAGKDLFPTHTSIQGKRPFNPNMPVTREDTIYALVNALGCMNNEKHVDLSVLNMFKDQNSISGDIKNHFAVALSHELVSGYPDDTIRAQAALTRAEFATLLLRGTKHGFHDTYQAKIQSVTVSPASPVEIEIGESVTMSARATYTDGKNLDYAAFSPYDADNNGVISLSGNTFTGIKEGTATIKYNSEYLKKDSLTVVVKKPTDGPQIKIYEYPEQTELSVVTVIGEIVDKNVAAVDLTANSKDIKIASDGSFNVNVPLEIGNNEIKFVAVNQYGAKAEKSINILRVDVPAIKITQYKERTTERSTPVSGVVEYYNMNNIKVTCNGEDVPFNNDGEFKINVDLKIGKNPFLFKATTTAGNTAEQAIVIVRFDYDEDDEEEKPPVVKPEKTIKVWDWRDTIPTVTKYKRVEAVLVIDDSGSLGGDYGYNSSTGTFTGGTDPEHKRLEVARNFVDSANDNTKIGIVKFDYNSEKVTPSLVTCNNDGKNKLKNILQINNGTFDSWGTTYMYTGINDALSLYESTDPEVMRVMIVFSDGMAHDTEKHAQTILAASNKNVTIYTVGLGSNNSSYFEDYMKPLSTNTGGTFYLAENAKNLKAIFEEIIISIDTVTDSDNDSIPDYYEDNMVDENGNAIAIDKNNQDTDGDGLMDGEEIRLEYEYNADRSKVKVTAYMSSDPTLKDTDGDGVSDKDDNYPLDAKNK